MKEELPEGFRPYMLAGRRKVIFSGLCDFCGLIFYSINTKKHYCSHPCYILNTIGDKHPRWMGGRSIRKQDGYVMVNARGHHEYRTNLHGRKRIYDVMEHVLVMEKYIGRRLEKYESVHHKNGIRTDNRIDNLELWAKHQPTGQRVSDLVDFVFTNYNKEIRNKILVQDLVLKVIERVSS